MEKSKETPTVKEYVNEEEVINDLFWKPENYGFKLITGDGLDRGSKWQKEKFTLIRLSSTLWVLKKFLGYQILEKGEVKKAKIVTKWHLVIDRKELADIYLTSGLRG